MVGGLLTGLRRDQDVIQIYKNKSIEHVLQNVINQGLEASWSIGEAQGHDKVFVVFLVC